MKVSSTEPQKKVAVIIPCHNEAAGIAGVVSKLPYDRLAQAGLQIKVLVIDNCSSDNTAAVAKAAGAEIVYEPNKGKGNALRAGFQNIPEDTDYVVMLDGDDTYSSEEVMRLIEPLHSDFCDVVVGSRLYGHIQATAMNRLNRLGNRIFTRAVQLLYGANVTDVLTGYFAWKKSALDVLKPYIKSPGFAIEMEMITKMAKLGHRMAAVPISYHPRAGTSNLHPLRDGYHILNMLVKNLVWQPRQIATPATETRTIDVSSPRPEVAKSSLCLTKWSLLVMLFTRI